MRRSLIWSASLHVLVLLLAVLGLPRLWDSKPPADTPIVLEVVKIDEKTRAKDIAKPKPPKKRPVKTPPPPEPPKVKPVSSVPPPPKPSKLAPPEKAEKVPVIKPKRPPKPKKKKAEAKPKKPKAKPPPRAIARARPRRRPPPSREDFLRSVLRDVAPEERAEKPKKSVKKKPEPAPPQDYKKTPVRRAPLDAVATQTEIDAIRRQIEACWNIPAGARDAASLVVSIRVWVNPDGTVAQARILDASRMARDGFFRTAAESALRAVLNPRCSPLRIPPKKYEQFKVLILNFNPKEAAGS